MPIYKYKAVTLEGKPVRGQLQAADKHELHDLLLQKELYLTASAETESTAVKAKLDTRQLADFCRELGMMLSAGVPLTRALYIMSRRDIKQNVKTVYNALYQAIKQGAMLSDAMEQQGRSFPQLLVSMMRASEASGSMDVTAIRMAEHYDKSHRLNQKVRSAMTYPIILGCITVIVLLIVFLVVLPRFFTLFESMNVDLPGVTQFMLNLSVFLKNQWIWLLAGIAVFIVGLKLLNRIPAVKRWRDYIKLKLPLVGKLLRIIYTARFARTLSSCYASGISIVSALTNTRDTVGNAYIASQFPEMVRKVRAGKSLSSAIGGIDGFDSKLAATVQIGEETGKLYDMLNSIADAFDYDSDMAMGRLTTMIEPIMLVLMAVVIGTVIVSVMLPMTTLYDAIGGAGI